MNELLEMVVTTIDGEKKKKDFTSDLKLIIIVILASKWAYAHKQNVELVVVYDEYKSCGLQVIAFPCN